MKHFTIIELSRSATAAQQGIDNTPNVEQQANLRCLVENLLDPIRERWGRAITVASGFRTPQVNSLVGGSATSDHQTGRAADISAGSPQLNRQLFEMIKTSGLQFDQMYGVSNFASVHVSFRKTGNRNQIITV